MRVIPRTFFKDCATPWFFTGQQECLQSAVLLANHSIPTIVWGPEALAFAHRIPTASRILQLLVHDHLVDKAAQIIQQNLPYYINPEPLPESLAYFHVYPDMPPCFPRSARLSLERPMAPVEAMMDEVIRRDILIHPKSFFQFDMADQTRSLPLDGFPDVVRCPTRTAFLDSCIATILDPPLGYFHLELDNDMWNYVADIIGYTLRKYPRVYKDGRLNAECRAVVDSLKEENRPWMEGCINRKLHLPLLDSICQRREIITRLGRASELKPFPLRVPKPRATKAVAYMGWPNLTRPFSPRRVIPRFHFQRALRILRK